MWKYLFGATFTALCVAWLSMQTEESTVHSVDFVPMPPLEELYSEMQQPLDTSSKKEDEKLLLKYPIPQPDVDGSLPEDKALYTRQGQIEDVSYDPKTRQYTVTQRIGNYVVGTKTMDFDEYLKYDMDKSIQRYWKNKNAAYTPSNSTKLKDLIPGLDVNLDFLSNLDMKNLIDIKFQGSVQVIFGFITNRRDDPAMDVQHRKTASFNFEQKLEINVNAKIGNRFDFNINHNTEALFDFDNKLKLKYEGKEDEIIKSLEAGDISFPLNNSLITGVQNLFGLKAKLQFGKTYVTGVFSQQRSESKNVKVEGGAQSTKIKFKADEYDENRHYFVAQYFRDNYHRSIAELPIVNTNVAITKIEVWVTNVGAPVDNNRNIVAFTDLAEAYPMSSDISGNPAIAYPCNESNNLLQKINVNNLRNINTVSNYLNTVFNYTGGREFEKVESARLLNPSEYSYNPRLGFISLNTPLNSDQVLGVAYQYQVIGSETVYQVGEFSDQGINDPQSIVVKLIKATTLNTKSPLWNLMMKNVYSLRAYQVSSQDFRLNILYTGDELGVPTGYFREGPKSGIPLIRVFGMDNLDFQMNNSPDGVFDFLDNASTGAGIVESSKGLIFMPYVEPFGRDLIQIFNGDSVAASKYAFNELYTMTKVEAQQYPDKNKYYFDGSFKSSQGSEISLEAYNVPRGSVKVTAGSNLLVEDVDYTVDYQMGIVRIINQGVLNSGVPINISTESNSNNVMTKRLMGLRIEHIFSKNLYVGGTIINLHESPITQKVNYGEEPISNTIYGFDAAYDKESRYLTKAVDAILPFSSSKIPARINLYGEFAHFLPGHSRAIGKEGMTYLDDFEGTKTTINLKEPYSWYVSSIPQFQPDLFIEGTPAFSSTRITGMNRAKLAWYTIDPLFYDNKRPKNITKDDLSQPYSRQVLVSEVFPNKELPNGEPLTLSVLNLAYYPSERGMYNYDAKPVPGVTSGINAEGKLNKPESRWAGIMRKIDNTDFEASNVEYIEFWVMDPFIGRDGKDGNPKHSGGKLYFNLGDISEDVLRDGRKSFENGMPISPNIIDVDTTQWGRVPKNQSIVRAFDNDPNTRQYQDIGLDGLGDDDERSFFVDYLQDIANTFGSNSAAYLNALEDPSADNYHYFRGGDYDQLTIPNQIQERYKKFNNPQGNSPSSTQNTEDYPTQQTNYPNTEEISGDNTLSEGETYFQYEVELDPDKMYVGENFISDIQEKTNITLPNGQTTSVRWYQFKIPIKSPDRVVGQIQNFQSIRFMRIFLRGFSEDVVLRFASLDLVKSDWRKYQSTLLDDNIHVSTNGNAPTQVNVSVVSIEENGQRQPIPYVMPPDIERILDPASQNSRKLNEQALSLQVLNLADGDARGVYKTTNFDFRQFKILQMYAHLEKVNEMDRAVNGDVTLFIRLGADFQENYYEYEIPLEYTQWGESARDLVWPAANKVQINLDELVQIKENRNAAMRSGNDKITYTTPYIERVGNVTYTVKGTPTISDVKTILIGVRNPQKNRLTDADDGQAKSVELWLNELSVNDFNKKGGTAATVRAQATLGDLGNISVAGAYATANFGDIEQKITELPKDNVTSFDVATNLELGKFVPEKVGMRIPFHYDVSASYSNPEYNPLDPDVKTSDDLATYAPEDRKRIKKEIQDYTFRQNVNLINVRKERTNAEKTPQFYDIENFNVSYSYSQVSRRNIDVEYDNKYTHRGGFGYDYSTASKYFEPFAKSKLAKNKAYAILTDLNFNYIPNQFSFSTEVLREFNENKMRNKSFGDILIEPTYFKRYDWTRVYVFKYDITKSISLSYNANANSYIQEPPGKIDTKDKKDSIWQSFLGFGTMQVFTQNFNATYKLPINKIPILNWINGDLSYASLYRWEASPISVQSRLGNTISNNMATGANGTADLVQLYNKVPFLKKINTPPSRRRTQQRSNTTIGQTGEAEKEDPETFKKIYSAVIRALMGFRNAGVTWTLNRGTILPGFTPNPHLFGTNFNLGAPGIPFVFGSQQDIRPNAVSNGWLTTDSLLNASYMNTRTESFTARTLFEPFSDFRIDINLGYSKASNNSSYYKYDAAHGTFVDLNPTGTGNYTVTGIMIHSSFMKMDANYVTEAYQNFLDYREVIARRLSAENPNSYGRPDVYDTATGNYYPHGYGSNSQDVMIPALIAAYMGVSPEKISLNTISRFPLPNWSLSYSGLTKIKGVKKIFKNIVLQHGYTSSYNVGSYTQNILFKQDLDGNATALDMNMNFISYRIMEGVSMMEQFSPLIKISLTLNNDLSTNFEMRKMRQINLSFVNNQLTEIQSNEWIIGVGYRIKDVGFKISAFGNSKRQIKSDIVLKADFSIRDNKTIIRKIDQSVYMPSAGARTTSINIYAEYEITKQLITRVFYDLILNKPYIENAFFNTTGKGGLSITYRFNE